MQPDFHFVLSPDRLTQAVIVFMAVGAAMLLTMFVHTAASEWLRLSRTQRRSQRMDQRIKDHVSKS
jgi:hypothetical protein